MRDIWLVSSAMSDNTGSCEYDMVLLPRVVGWGVVTVNATGYPLVT